MDKRTLSENIQSLKPWNHILRFESDLTSPGKWDSSMMFNSFAPYLPSSLKEASVLDIGANAGGISFEFAERGAQVTSLEPSEQHRQQAILYKNYKDIKNVDIIDDTLFNAHRYGRFDIVLALGLLYHFRYPQLVIDYLSNIVQDTLIVSTQTKKGEALSMINRKQVAKSTRINDKKVLGGWHPTFNLFVKMLELAGFSQIQEIPISSERLNFGDKNVSFTNTCYLIAKRSKKPIDIEFEKARYI